MIVIAFGSNLPHPDIGQPLDVARRALGELETRGIRIIARSRFYESEPVPVSDQPWYVNGVVEVETDLAPGDLLALLHEVEAAFGRVRKERNEARILDLDIIDYHGLVNAEAPILPHPRLHERAFVLIPLSDIAPEWHHPTLGSSIGDLLAGLGDTSALRPVQG